MDSPCSTVNPNIWILTSSGVLMLFFPFWYLSIIKLQATQWTRECNWFEIKAKWLRGLIVQAGQSEKKVNKHFVIHDENQIGAESNSANFLQAKFSSVSLAGAVWVPRVRLSDWKSSRVSRAAGHFWTINLKQAEGGWFSEHFTCKNLVFLKYLHQGNKKSDVEVVLPQTAPGVVAGLKNTCYHPRVCWIILMKYFLHERVMFFLFYL